MVVVVVPSESVPRGVLHIPVNVPALSEQVCKLDRVTFG